MSDLHIQLANFIQTEAPNQVLHIPFAKPANLPSGMQVWDNWYHDQKQAKNGYDILTAKADDEIRRAEKPLVFISGGSDHKALLDQINNNKILKELVIESPCLICECSGAMIIGKYFRKSGSETELIQGLNILPDTIVEPHYDSRNRKATLKEGLLKKKCRYGIGIKSLGALRCTTKFFPYSIKNLGERPEELIINTNSKLESVPIK